jgi:hypothetical protein
MGTKLADSTLVDKNWCTESDYLHHLRGVYSYWLWPEAKGMGCGTHSAYGNLSTPKPCIITVGCKDVVCSTPTFIRKRRKRKKGGTMPARTATAVPRGKENLFYVG